MTPGVYVVAHLTPRRPLSPLATLPIPTPLDVQFAGGLLAYRADGVEARVANSGRLRGPYGGAAGVAESKAFADLWLAAGEGSLPSLPAPHALQREAGRRAVPPGRPARRSAAGSGEPGDRLARGARQADLRATARLTAPGGDLSFVEWEVPADVVVTHVGGRDGRDPIWQWSRTCNRVQAWLDHTMGVVDVELDGWKELAPEKDGARFDLPGVRLLSARAATTSVRLTPTADLALTAEDTQSLLPLPDPRSSESYAPRGPAYGGRFHVRRAAAGAEARVLTTAEVVAGQLAFTSHVEYRSEAAGTAWKCCCAAGTAAARLDVKGARRRSEVRAPGRRTFVGDRPAGRAGAGGDVDR